MSDKKKPSIFARLLKETKLIAGWLVLVAIIALICVGLELLGPIYLGEVIDLIYDYWSGKTSLDMSLIATDCLVLAGIYAGNGGLSLLKMYILNYSVSNYFTCAIRIKISEKIERMSVGYVDRTSKGEIISRMMDDVSTLGNSVHTFLDIFISGVLKLIAIAIIVFSINPVLAIPVIAFVPISVFLSSKIAKKSGKYYSESREYTGKTYSITEEDYTGFETIRAFNLAERQNREHAKIVDSNCKALEKANSISNLIQPIIVATNNIAYILICLIGGYLSVTGSTPVGEIMTFILYAKLFAGPLESIAEGFSEIQHTIASGKRVYEILDEEEMDMTCTAEPAYGPGEVVFEDVCFSYNKDEELIRNLNIHVKPGQKVAIVGPTGGGKTTIVNLLMRFYDIDSGHIVIDGVDTMTMDRAKLRGLFGMVLQDTWLFSGTIYDNIAYGSENVTREQVEEAARRAHLDYFIGTLPEGYNTMINEESSNISSGQKQLLTIARAYLSNRPMLILDEATSNVDTRTELLIQETMDELMKGRTSFVIAHRLSTIVDADIILVVNNGQIVESGSHSELMAKNGFYSEIYNSQYALLT